MSVTEHRLPHFISSKIVPISANLYSFAFVGISEWLSLIGLGLVRLSGLHLPTRVQTLHRAFSYQHPLPVLKLAPVCLEDSHLFAIVIELVQVQQQSEDDADLQH